MEYLEYRSSPELREDQRDLGLTAQTIRMEYSESSALTLLPQVLPIKPRFPYIPALGMLLRLPCGMLCEPWVSHPTSPPPFWGSFTLRDLFLES